MISVISVGGMGIVGLDDLRGLSSVNDFMIL